MSVEIFKGGEKEDHGKYEILEEWESNGEGFRRVRALRSPVKSNASRLCEWDEKHIDHASEGGPEGWQMVPGSESDVKEMKKAA